MVLCVSQWLPVGFQITRDCLAAFKRIGFLLIRSIFIITIAVQHVCSDAELQDLQCEHLCTLEGETPTCVCKSSKYIKDGKKCTGKENSFTARDSCFKIDRRRKFPKY